MSKIDRFPGCNFLVGGLVRMADYKATFYGIKLLDNEDCKSMQCTGVLLILW